MVGYGRILEELRRQAANKPERAPTLSFHIDLISAQARTAVGSYEFPKFELEAARRLQKGLPVLSPEKFHADSKAVAYLCDQVCAITMEYRPELVASLNEIRVWLEKEWYHILGIVAEYLRDEGFRKGEDAHSGHLNDRILGAGSQVWKNAGAWDPLLAFVLNQALHPFLRKCAKTFAPLVDDSVWYRPYCPICGGAPDFAALIVNGARRLLCSRCDFEWSFFRGSCLFCGYDAPGTQTHSAIDQGHYLYTCTRCRRDLKTIELRPSEGERLLPIERILAGNIAWSVRAMRETPAYCE